MLPKTITLHITETHIREGCMGDAGNCPTARALQERFPGYRVWVKTPVTILESDTNQEEARYDNSIQLYSQIKYYDGGGAFQPGRYRLTRYAYNGSNG